MSLIQQEKKRLWVAVGVIENEQDQIFICQRAARQHQAGKWEFPGGKVEEGETLQQALKRELFEEIGIEVEACEPLLKIEHDYADKAVLLDVWRVTAFSGSPYGKEGQPGLWVARPDLVNYDFPEANQPITLRVIQG